MFIYDNISGFIDRELEFGVKAVENKKEETGTRYFHLKITVHYSGEILKIRWYEFLGGGKSWGWIIIFQKK